MAGSGEQLRAYFDFELFDLLGESALCDVQSFCRF